VGQRLTISHHCFRLPKRGNSWEEFEDAYACDPAAGRFAIADGASESIFAGEWAHELCQAFVADRAAVGKMEPWLAFARNRWQDRVGMQTELWHVAEKLRDGSFATFLGLTIDSGGRWRAIAVGDSCMFHVHGGSLACAFPVDSSSAFGTRPELIGSHRNGRIRVAGARGRLMAGDTIALMSDALAEWFLKQHEDGRSPWRELAGLPEAGFAEWVQTERAQHRLKNDDVTLLAIDLKVTNT
jgi:hypothetical protein